MFECDLELLPRVAVQGVVDDVAAAFLQGQRQAEEVLLRALASRRPNSCKASTARMTSSGVACSSRIIRGPPSREEVAPALPIRSVRMAMSSDCGAVPAKARTFWSKPAVMAGADWPAKRARVGQEPLVAVTFLLRIERLAHAVGVEDQGVARAQRQFRALEFETGLEAERGAEVPDRPARRARRRAAAPGGNGRHWPA